MGQAQIGAVSWRCWRRRRTEASRWSLRQRPQLRLHPNGAPRPKRMQRALLQNRELQCMHMAHTYVGMEQRCRQRHQHPHPQNLRHPPMDGPKRHQGASCELSGRHLAPRLNIKRAATDYHTGCGPYLSINQNYRLLDFDCTLRTRFLFFGKLW